MRAILSADEHWGIGRENRLLVRIPQDMKYFRNETVGKAVIMGRKTLESFPGGRPLEGRLNVVLTRNGNYRVKGAVVVHSVEAALEAVREYAPEDVYCIGGSSVYRLFLPCCDTVFVTRIQYSYEADAYFPDLDALPEWRLVGRSEEQTYFDLAYEFCRYERVGREQKP
ncbi:MAG: dihydrofolate reductase [Lachnospiraceae bacterium]|nr:dihydrofolate reductase [Lachnospiraceae bacterium]